MADNSMFVRNSGYIADDIQHKIYQTRVLIAGCGLGSYIAEALVRMGCQHIILVDHDTIDIHNLNRQNYIYTDIGHSKAECLKHRLLMINPEASIKAINAPIAVDNVEALIGEVDIVIDTIDFLSVKALLALYQQCYLQKKTIISALSAGWGAIGFYIPASNQTKNWFKEIFQVSDMETQDPKEYVHYFTQLIARIKPYLPLDVSENLGKVFQLMAENKPCPASQIAPGAFAAAALCSTIFHRYLANQEIVELPFAMGLDINETAQQKKIPFC